MGKEIATLELAVQGRPDGVTLAHWLYEELKRAIRDGRLPPGARLPATRELARQYGISRGTVVAAFDQLMLAGYVHGRVGSGTWVSEQAPRVSAAGKRPHPLATARPGPLAGLTFTRPARPFFLQEPALAEFPTRVWSRLASRRMSRRSVSMLTGSYPGSYPPLRQAIAEYLGSVRGVRCTPDQVAVTTGVQQGLDILARLLVRPGEAVWLEDPGYFGASLAFRNAGAAIIGVPVDEQGLRVKDGEKLSLDPVRCAYVTPGHQFPLGSTLSPGRRLELLVWAARSGAYVIEDDYDSEFRFDGEPVPSLHSLDQSRRVILVGTFNKLLFPSLRVGYAVLPDELVDRFHAFRYGTDLNGMSMQQTVLSDFIAEGYLAKHIRRMRDLYGVRLATLLDEGRKCLAGLFDISPVRAGLYTVGMLRTEASSSEAEAMALTRGVETIGLHRFTLRQPDPRGLLLGFAAFDEARIRTGVRQLADALEPQPRVRAAASAIHTQADRGP
jgi:GntR family transcriptional regulator/MocR family aminotransferase